MSEPQLHLSDADINRTAACYMGETAWSTVWLTLIAVAGYGALVPLVGAGWLGLVPGFCFAAYFTYVIYTPLHESVHRNICGRHRELLWLNQLMGYLAATVIGASYTMHRSAHMAHHRSTNVDGEDPDLVTRGHSIWAILSCGPRMFVSEYRDYFVRVFPTAPRRERLTIIAEVSAIVGWRLALAANGYAVEVLVLTVLANVVGLSLLGYLFAWLVHTPFVETERYRDTATLLLPGPVHRLLTRLWLWQNYHSIHHLFPRVPFYRYSALFDEIRPGMEERGAPIVQLGSGRAGRDSIAGANLPS